jgi:TonB family protein
MIEVVMRALALFVLIVLAPVVMGQDQTRPRKLNLAVLDFGNPDLGRVASDRLGATLKSLGELSIIDRDSVRLAARGAGYSGSLNLSLREARDLGDAIGCDFYLIGDAQTLRRTNSSNPVYFESYASIFLVSSRSGKLVMWERPSFTAANAAAAEQKLLQEVSGVDFSRRWIDAARRCSAEEKERRSLGVDNNTPIIEDAPDDEKEAEASGLRLPKPFRRLRPPYPDSAARAGAEGVVDVLVELDAAGEVSNVDLARWAGFGLDEATVSTVRQLHFFPAMRNGTPIPIRVLLRYNFHRPSQ